MKKYLDLKGSTLFDEKGSDRGIIENCIVDLKKKKICSVIVSKEELFKDTFLLSYKNVLKIGEFVTFNGELYKLNKHLIKKNGDIMLQNLMGKEIITSEGEKLGILVDLMFDENTGEIKILICSRGFFEDVFEGRKIIMVDNNTILEKQRIIVGSERIDMINNISLGRSNKG